MDSQVIGTICTTRRQRDRIRSSLHLLLLFSSPLILSSVLLLILVIIYHLRPFMVARDFTQTSCTVVGTDVLPVQVSCSAGTDAFTPCARIHVSYSTGGESTTRGILLENEQALVNCNPCSYTFGKYGLFHRGELECGGWKENFDPNFCVELFLKEFGNSNSTYPCYFNPNNEEQVVRQLNVDVNTVSHTLAWPLLACVVYALLAAFVSYDAKQRRLREKSLKKVKQSTRSHLYLSSSYKKKRLSISLGVKPPKDGPRINVNTNNIEIQSKRFSVSVPAHLHNMTSNLSPTLDDPVVHDDIMLEVPCGLDEDFDMRHLDLAVSEYNIDSLTANTSYFNTPHEDSMHFNTSLAGAHNNPVFYNTLPLQCIHEHRTDNRSRSHDFIGLDDDVYNGILASTPAPQDAISVTNSTMISEQDIDLYYTLSSNCRQNSSVILNHSNRSETTV